MNNEFGILVLISHPSEDARIIKYWDYIKKNYKEHQLVQFQIIKETHSQGVSNWFVIDALLNKNRLNRRIALSVSNQQYVDSTLRIINHWESNRVIIHVHDAILLPIAAKIKKQSNKEIKIIYDKHESGKYLTLHLSMFEIAFNERIYKKNIDGIVTVSQEAADEARKIFPKNCPLCVVPNYPKEAWRKPNVIQEKIECNESFSIVYFGSLLADRDIELMCEVSKNALDVFSGLNVIIGGRNPRPDTLAMLNRMHELYCDRFKFLGDTPYADVIKLTQSARFGLLAMRPGKGFKGKKIASNKLNEYLLLGTVPLINWGDSTPVVSGNYYIPIRHNSEDYISSIKNELANKSIVKKILKDFYSQTWENHAPKYDVLYKKVFDTNNGGVRND